MKYLLGWFAKHDKLSRSIYHDLRKFIRAECMGSPGIIDNRTPKCHPVSWAWMHGWPYNWTELWLASYVSHWRAWLLVWHVMHGCLYDQILADVRSTGAGIKCLYCSYCSQWQRLRPRDHKRPGTQSVKPGAQHLRSHTWFWTQYWIAIKKLYYSGTNILVYL